MKNINIILVIVTLTIEIAITYLISLKLSIRFVELMFFTGLVFSVISFWFFSSGGDGSWSHAKTHSMKGLSGATIEHENFRFTRNPFFTASILFLSVGLVLFILLLMGVIPPA